MSHASSSLPTSFDYVIVGAGSAGCVLANRLSADGTSIVCLLEGGGSDADPRVQVPAGTITLLPSKTYNYAFSSAPEDELGGRTIPVPRGKGLGGSSSINSMIYVRGHRSDYDGWRESGCVGWGYDDVLPLFKRSESYLNGPDSEFHGHSGELQVTKPRDPNPFSKHFVKAAAAHAGLVENGDFNGHELEGVGLFDVTQSHGKRLSSYRAFVHPIRGRRNLFTLTDCTVERLVLDGDRVTDVEVRHRGASKMIGVRGEVVLSAGSIGSPQILFRSGIGPAAMLRDAGIDVLHELPGVGQNLQDHFGARVSYRSDHGETLGFSSASLPKIAAAPFDYVARRRGWWTTNYVEAGGFAKTPHSNDTPDVQFHFVPGYRESGKRPAVFERGHGYSVHTCVLRPRSRGQVTVERDGDRLRPRLAFNFLSDEHDRRVLVAGMKIARSILRSPHFAELGGHETEPGPDVRSDEQLLAHAKALGSTVFHPAGTCAMGVGDGAVVTPDLKVVGLRGLRIADASIMPTLVSGNTNAPTIMIGEKCADLMIAAQS